VLSWLRPGLAKLAIWLSWLRVLAWLRLAPWVGTGLAEGGEGGEGGLVVLGGLLAIGTKAAAVIGLSADVLFSICRYLLA